MTFPPRAQRALSECLPVVILAMACAIVMAGLFYVLVLMVGGGQ